MKKNASYELLLSSSFDFDSILSSWNIVFGEFVLRSAWRSLSLYWPSERGRHLNSWKDGKRDWIMGEETFLADPRQKPIGRDISISFLHSYKIKCDARVQTDVQNSVSLRLGLDHIWEGSADFNRMSLVSMALRSSPSGLLPWTRRNILTSSPVSIILSTSSMSILAHTWHNYESVVSAGKLFIQISFPFSIQSPSTSVDHS